MLCVSLENTIHNNPNIRAAFRPSMKKFDSDNYSIDIVRSSDFSLSFLNRQIILLLSSRRIHDSVFHQIQNEMLDKVMTMNDSAECAMDTLWKFNGSSTGNGTHCMMNNYLSRFHLNTEPFVQQLLVAFQAFQLKELRTKARILIEKGCVLFGVADESRTLEHEEVFIQIHRRELNETRIIEGPVIVTRNPCLHPGKTSFFSEIGIDQFCYLGDIRRYEAVDNPRLHKLKNVIVFPMDGPRSMTTELAGGDLDGDTFWISWDSRLIFPGNYEAFCYSDQARQAKEATANACKTSYTIDDVCHFFAQYIKADNLGIIATWHMALADRYGAEDNRCLSLASKHRFVTE